MSLQPKTRPPVNPKVENPPGHTPTPWRITGDGCVVDPQGVEVDAEANREFVIRACNAHDELLGVAKEADGLLEAFIDITAEFGMRFESDPRMARFGGMWNRLRNAIA